MREMKDSGIQWVGLIPSDWKSLKLQYACETITDYTASGSFADLAANITYLDDEDYAMLVRTADLSAKREMGHVYVDKHAYDYLHNSNLYGGEIILPNIGSVGSVYYYEPMYEYATLAPNAIMLRTENNRYLYYLFLTKPAEEALNRLSNATTQAKFNKTQLRKMKVILPDKNTQKSIVAFLDSKCAEIDALCADIESEIETLEAYKRSVITEAVTKGLDKNVPMKDSGTPWCPLIPSHWEYTNPKALFAQRFDRAFPGERQLTASQEHGIVYQDEFMEITGNRVVTVMKDFNILKHVEPGDFVISMRSFQGGLEYSEVKGCISSAYVMLIPNKELVYPPFYKWFFKSDKYINAIQSTSNLVRDGQAMRYANFVKVPLFVIPLDEQKRIADYLDGHVSEINSIIKEKQEQLTVLADYKKSVIYEYVTGKKEVPA